MVITAQPTPITLTATAVPPIATVGPVTAEISLLSPWAHFTPVPDPHTVVITPRVVACMVVCDTVPQPESNMGFVATGRCYEKQKVTTLARVVLPANGLLLQGLVTGDASGTNITLNVYDLSDGEVLVSGPTALTCSAVVYDALQIGAGWSADATGYNFKHEFDGATVLLNAGHRYRIEYTIPTDEGNAYVVSVVATDRVFS